MQNIYLSKPVILKKSLTDMSAPQRRDALDLLENRKYLTFDETGIRLISPKEFGEHSTHFYYGSEAVCIYRQSLGLADIGIHAIKVMDILGQLADYDVLQEICSHLRRIQSRNDRFIKLSGMGAPFILLVNEYRSLQEYVETLDNNNYGICLCADAA